MVTPPFVDLPGVVVSTGVTQGPHGPTPVGVQLLANRFREDLVLDAAEAIERGMTERGGTPELSAVAQAEDRHARRSAGGQQ